MADWEDDDFGGFESADLDSVPAPQTLPPSDPAGIAQAASPSHGSSGAVQVLDWILSNTPKSEGSPLNAAGSPSSFATSAEQDEKAKPEGVLNLSAEDQVRFLSEKLSQGDAALALNPALKETVEISTAAEEMSPQYMESKNAIQSLAAEEAKMEIHRQEKALQDLQAKLDAAIAMKEQTEKSVEKLQDDLKQQIQRNKLNLEERNKKHEESVEAMKKQHFDEMKALQKTSEDTAELISKQYADVWKLFEKEKEAEVESNANVIVNKCCEILTQQQGVLTQKLEDCKLNQEKEVQKVLTEEREKMESELKKRLEEERESIEHEMNQHFKEELAKEINRLEEVHAATLREAMANQELHFENLLKSTLQNERDKFSETLEEAVEKAQKDMETALVERKKTEEIRTRNHTMSLKMFLTSALKQIEGDLTDSTGTDATGGT